MLFVYSSKMEKIHYIYGLYSTRKLKETGLVRVKYVGRSPNPTSRLQQHLSGVGKKDNILCRWMSHELAKGFEIKVTILDQCLAHEVVELEKHWIEKIGKGRKLLNTVSNDQNSPNQLHQEIKRLKAEIVENSKVINELTGVKRARGLINELHLFDNTKKMNKELRDKIEILENYIQNDLQQPLPYNDLTRKKKRKPKTDI
jgi:hypothetical protein